MSKQVGISGKGVFHTCTDSKTAWHVTFWNREMTAAKAGKGRGERKDESGGSPDPRELVWIFTCQLLKASE